MLCSEATGGEALPGGCQAGSRRVARLMGTCLRCGWVGSSSSRARMRPVRAPGAGGGRGAGRGAGAHALQRDRRVTPLEAAQKA